MTAELQGARYRDGVPIYLTVTVQNRGTEPVHWSQTGCRWSTYVSVEPVPRFEFGRTWDGDAAHLKRTLMDVWASDALYNFGSVEEPPPKPSYGCFTEGARSQALAR
jgi:hypothetical protein